MELARRQDKVGIPSSSGASEGGDARGYLLRLFEGAWVVAYTATQHGHQDLLQAVSDRAQRAAMGVAFQPKLRGIAFGGGIVYGCVAGSLVEGVAQAAVAAVPPEHRRLLLGALCVCSLAGLPGDRSDPGGCAERGVVSLLDGLRGLSAHRGVTIVPAPGKDRMISASRCPRISPSSSPSSIVGSSGKSRTSQSCSCPWPRMGRNGRATDRAISDSRRLPNVKSRSVRGSTSAPRATSMPTATCSVLPSRSWTRRWQAHGWPRPSAPGRPPRWACRTRRGR